MSEVGFTGNSSNLNKLLDSAARKIVEQKSAAVLREARGSTKTHKNALRYTVTGIGHNDLEGRVGSNDPAVRFEEQGTRPHIIRARHGRVMVFPGTKAFQGKTIHTAVVHHPGTRGSHFLKAALRKVIK